MTTKLHNTTRNATGIFIGTMAIALALSADAHAFRYGAMCNNTYWANPTGAPNAAGQINWQVNSPEGPAACSAFLSGMSPSSGAWRFNWGTDNGEVHALQKAWTRWESDYVESVDFMYYLGHGGLTNATDWFTAGAPFNETVGSASMCFGSTQPGQPQASGQRGLSVLALSSCDSLTPVPTVVVPNPNAPPATIIIEPVIPASPNNEKIDFPPRAFAGPTNGTVWGHWLHAMSCGLRMINGTWQEMLINGSTVQARNYAFYLTHGSTFEAAWNQSVKDAEGSHAAPATLATGSNAADCFDNLHHLNLSNVNAKPRITTTGFPCMSVAW